MRAEAGSDAGPREGRVLLKLMSPTKNKYVHMCFTRSSRSDEDTVQAASYTPNELAKQQDEMKTTTTKTRTRNLHLINRADPDTAIRPVCMCLCVCKMIFVVSFRRRHTTMCYTFCDADDIIKFHLHFSPLLLAQTHIVVIMVIHTAHRDRLTIHSFSTKHRNK